MIIGLDIDDVIFKTSDAINSLFDVNNLDEEIIKHRLDLMRGDTVNEKIKKFLDENISIILKTAKPFEGAAEYIKSLRAQHHKIVLITARSSNDSSNTKEITENALKKYNIEYDKIIYNSKDKAMICKENNIELFIDDSPKNCLDVINNLDIPVIGFESNITREELRKNNIKSVNNWKDLIKLINQISDNKKC